MPSVINPDSGNTVKQWKSEHMVPCSFCGNTASKHPVMIVVSLELGNVNQSICEVCLRGANCATARAYARLGRPTSPIDPKRKRVSKR